MSPGGGRTLVVRGPINAAGCGSARRGWRQNDPLRRVERKPETTGIPVRHLPHRQSLLPGTRRIRFGAGFSIWKGSSTGDTRPGRGTETGQLPGTPRAGPDPPAGLMTWMGDGARIDRPRCRTALAIAPAPAASDPCREELETGLSFLRGKKPFRAPAFGRNGPLDSLHGKGFDL